MLISSVLLFEDIVHFFMKYPLMNKLSGPPSCRSESIGMAGIGGKRNLPDATLRIPDRSDVDVRNLRASFRSRMVRFRNRPGLPHEG